MDEAETPREPEKDVVPTSRYNSHDEDVDVESQQETQQAPSFLTSTYGVNPADQPLQPPRRVASQKSLKRIQSSNSLHSSQFHQQRSPNDGIPPLPPGDGPLGAANNSADDDERAEELAWGPSHPCYPHLNPHVPKNSPDHITTRVIRIRRDWMVVGDLAPTFSNIYPEILDPLISESEFRYMIQHINTTLVQAFDPFASANWVDAVLGFVTGWFWEDFSQSGIKGRLKKLEGWIEEWNRIHGLLEGVRIISLRRTGYMNLDIVIPDPQVRLVGHGESRGPTTDGETGLTVGSEAKTEREVERSVPSWDASVCEIWTYWKIVLCSVSARRYRAEKSPATSTERTAYQQQHQGGMRRREE